MTKVCHLTSVHKWNDTRIFFKECITLADAGYTTYLVAPEATEGLHHGVEVKSVPVRKKGRIYRATVVAWKVFKKGLSTKSAIYHFHDPELIWVGVLLRMAGKKVIYDVHENVQAQILDKKWLVFPKLVAFIYSIAEWFASKMFSIVIAEDSYEEIYRNKTKDITRVLNFPDLEEFRKLKSSVRSSKNGILYIGLVSKLRGIHEIISALYILKKKEIDFTFHCVGPLSDELRGEIDKRDDYQQIKENIIFYGSLPVYEAYQLASVSKIGVSILHPVPNYLRSYSTKIFEYMAVGLPFIVSDFQIYDFVKEQQLGFCIDPFSVTELAENFEKILMGQVDTDTMVKRQEYVVEHFYSWKSQARNLLELYKRLNPVN